MHPTYSYAVRVCHHWPFAQLHLPAHQSDLRAVFGSCWCVPFAVPFGVPFAAPFPVLPVPAAGPEPCRRAKMSERAAEQSAAYGLSATSCCLANSEPSAAAARRSLLAASSSPARRFGAHPRCGCRSRVNNLPRTRNKCNL